MISSNDLRPGITVELENTIYEVVESQHLKLGRGGAIVRSKLKNLKTGSIIERTFRAGEKLELVRIDHEKMQFLYRDKDEYYFMDQNTYEQITLFPNQLGEATKYLKENLVVDILFYKNSPLGVELPYFVELSVVDTEPGLRGNTVSGGSKPAKLETGLIVQVPLFINIGGVIRVDTRTAEYIERVS